MDTLLPYSSPAQMHDTGFPLSLMTATSGTARSPSSIMHNARSTSRPLLEDASLVNPQHMLPACLLDGTPPAPESLGGGSMSRVSLCSTHTASAAAGMSPRSSLAGPIGDQAAAMFLGGSKFQNNGCYSCPEDATDPSQLTLGIEASCSQYSGSGSAAAASPAALHPLPLVRQDDSGSDAAGSHPGSPPVACPTTLTVSSSTDATQAAGLICFALQQPGVTSFSVVSRLGPGASPGSAATLCVALRVAVAARRIHLATQSSTDLAVHPTITFPDSNNTGQPAPEQGSDGGVVALHVYHARAPTQLDYQCPPLRVELNDNPGHMSAQLIQVVRGGWAHHPSGLQPAQLVFGAAAARCAVFALAHAQSQLAAAGQEVLVLPDTLDPTQASGGRAAVFVCTVVPSCLLPAAHSSELQDARASSRQQLNADLSDPSNDYRPTLDAQAMRQLLEQAAAASFGGAPGGLSPPGSSGMLGSVMSVGGRSHSLPPPPPPPPAPASLLPSFTRTSTESVGGCSDVSVSTHVGLSPGHLPTALAYHDLLARCGSTGAQQGPGPHASLQFGGLGLAGVLEAAGAGAAAAMAATAAAQQQLQQQQAAAAAAAVVAAAAVSHRNGPSSSGGMNGGPLAIPGHGHALHPSTAPLQGLHGSSGGSSSRLRTRKADWVIVTEDTAIKNAAGAIAKVLGRVAPQGLCCPVFMERKTNRFTGVVSVAVKAIAVARGYVSNEDTGHDVGFQPYIRGDPSACAYGAARPAGAPAASSASIAAATELAARHADLLAASSLAAPLFGRMSHPMLGGASGGRGEDPSLADLLALRFGGSPPPTASSPAGSHGMYMPGSSPGALLGLSPPHLGGGSPPPGLAWPGLGGREWGLEVTGGSGGSSVCGDDVGGGSSWQELEHVELAFDVYKVVLPSDASADNGGLPVKVTAHSRPGVVSNIITKLVLERGGAVLITAGGRAMHIAMLAVVGARQRLQAQHGTDVLLLPKFVTVDTTNTLGWESVFLRFNIIRFSPTAVLSDALAARLGQMHTPGHNGGGGT